MTDLPSEATEPTSNDDGPIKRVKKPWTVKRVLVRLILWGITLGLLYWVFAIKLPSEISYADVWAAITALSLADTLVLSAAGVLTVIAVGWTSAAVLPGLPLRQGTQSSVVGQLTSVALPPPGDLIIRFGMYRSYGFTNDRSAVAVILAGIVRYFTVVAMPLIGLAAVLVTGKGSWALFWWFVAGSVIFWVAFVLMGRIIGSDKFAHSFGRFVARVSERVIGWFHRTPPKDLERSVVDFSRRTRAVAVHHFPNVSASTLGWGFSCFLVMWPSARFAGLGSNYATLAQILLVTGLTLFLNAFPITPGGVGVTEAILLSVITLPTAEAQASFTAALFLYRVFTWLLPFPIGAVAFFMWRWQERTGRIKKFTPDDSGYEPTPQTDTGEVGNASPN